MPTCGNRCEVIGRVVFDGFELLVDGIEDGLVGYIGRGCRRTTANAVVVNQLRYCLLQGLKVGCKLFDGPFVWFLSSGI